MARWINHQFGVAANPIGAVDFDERFSSGWVGFSFIALTGSPIQVDLSSVSVHLSPVPR